MHVRDEKVIQNFDWKIQREQGHGRYRYRWEQNINLDLKATYCESMDWIHLTQDTVQWWASLNMVMNLWVPYKMGNFFTSWATVSFSRTPSMDLVSSLFYMFNNGSKSVILCEILFSFVLSLVCDAVSLLNFCWLNIFHNSSYLLHNALF
jgi:hypothetical protein